MSAKAGPLRRTAALAAALTGLLLAACGGRSGPGAQPAAAPGPAAVRTIVVATVNEPPHLNPAITTAGPVHVVAESMFNGLVSLDREGNPVPELAERWEVRDGGRTYVFRLRSGITWHDGRPFTAEDVKFTFEEILLRFHARTKAGLQDVLEGIDTPDPATVVFRFKVPYAPLLRRLDVTEAPILPKHLYEATDPLENPLNQRPVGTGPFRFAEWQRGQQVVMVRNDAYFRPGRPRVDRLVFRFVPDAAAAAVALERGEVDYLWSVGGADLARLRGAPGITLERSPAGPGGSYCVVTLVPNLRHPALGDVKVRQALYHALDRKFVLERVYHGQGRVAHGPVASTAPFFAGDLPRYAYDPARAARLLDEAGYPARDGGRRLALRFTYAQPNFGTLAEVLKDHWGRVGVEVVLEPLDFNAAVNKVYVEKDFDVAVASLCGGVDPDIGVKRLLTSKNIAPIPFSNGALYENPAVDALLDQATQTVDESRRKELYRELQHRVAADLPYFWLVESEGYRAYRSALKGVAVSSGNAFEDAYLAEP